MNYICELHADKGVQQINFDSFHGRNHGCKYCGIIKTNKYSKNNRSKEDDVKRLFDDIPDIEYMGMNFINGRCNVEFICNKHKQIGVQLIKKNEISRRKHICYECFKDSIKLQDFEDRIYNKNLDIKLLNDYHGKNTLMECLCMKCGHNWTVKAGVLLDHCSCPICRNTVSESERILMKILESHNIEYEFQKRFDDCVNIRPLPFDFYLSKYNTAIEYDGEHHYKIIPRGNLSDIELQEQFDIIQHNDSIKTKYCINKNINLIRIPYWEKKNMESFLFEKFNELKINII